MITLHWSKKRSIIVLVSFLCILFTMSSVFSIENFGTSSDSSPISTEQFIPEKSNRFATATAGTYEDYVDAVSALYAPADKGTHSSFAEEQDYDGVYDTLTEANQGGVFTFGSEEGTGTSYSTLSANQATLGVYSCSNTGTVTSIVSYGRGGSATTNVKAIITDSSGNLLANGISNSVEWTTTAGPHTHTFATPPSVSASTTYWIGLVVSGTTRIYYFSTSGGTIKTDTTNSYTSPTSPTDATGGTLQWRLMYANGMSYDYELDLEVKWTSLDTSATSATLAIYGGTQGAEALKVDIWNDTTSAYDNLISDVAEGWNNVTITSYYDAAVEIRFIDTDQSGESTQHTWEVEAVLIRYVVPNLAPVNTNALVTNLDDTDFLYAQYKTYNFSVTTTDTDGYADFDTVVLSMKSGATTLFTVTYDEDDNSFSETTNPTYIELTGSVYSKVSTTLNVYFGIKVEFVCTDVTDYDLELVVTDSVANSDTDTYDVNYNVETRLDFSSYSLNDGSGTIDRGGINGIDTITASGVVIYFGSTLKPPSDAVDVWVSCSDVADSPWSDLILTSGAFLMTVDSDDVVGLDTYTFIVVAESAGSGGTNQLHDSHTDTYIADKVLFSSTVNMTWRYIGGYILQYNYATYSYDSTAYQGTATWVDNTNGSITESVAGSYTYYVVSFSDTYHGITAFDNTTSSVCSFDAIEFVRFPIYRWTIYNVESVWLLFGINADLQWSLNDSAIQDDFLFYSKINSTNNAWCMSKNGVISGFSIGPFTPIWYYVTIDIVVLVDGSYYSVWSKTIVVDIEHDFYLEYSSIFLSDDYVTFGIYSNRRNSTFYIWDNITGTPSYIGGSNEGWYQVPKSSTSGVHRLIILVNSTQGTVDSTSQVVGTVTTTLWLYVTFSYTVNAVTLEMKNVIAIQNNETIMISGFFYVPNTTIIWTVYEAGVFVDSGILVLVASGEYNTILWTKSNGLVLQNFTLTITSGASSITIYGYSLVIDGSTYIQSWSVASLIEGDSFMAPDGDAESVAFWNTMGIIIVSVLVPFSIGIAYTLNEFRHKKRRSKPRDKISDLYRSKGEINNE